MKKSFLSAIALTFLVAPVLTSFEASAQNRGREARQELREDRREIRQDRREFRREIRRDRRELRQDRRQAGRPAWLKRGGRLQGGQRIGDYRRYGLRAPARGQYWVRYNNDYVLASIAGGIIASIIAGR